MRDVVGEVQNGPGLDNLFYVLVAELFFSCHNNVVLDTLGEEPKSRSIHFHLGAVAGPGNPLDVILIEESSHSGSAVSLARRKSYVYVSCAFCLVSIVAEVEIVFLLDLCTLIFNKLHEVCHASLSTME